MGATYDLLIRARGDSRDAQRAMKQLQGSVRRTGEKMKAAGRVMTTAVTLPVLAAGVASIKLASDAEETASKLKVTFGGATKGLVRDLDAFADATGSSRFALQEQAATIGALLKPMGLSKAAFKDMSLGTVQLAKDLSSFHNIAEDDALEKLRAGLTGEAEPLKSLGILINETTMKQEAYRTGIAKTGSVLTEQQKVQARYSLIMKQSADAQGDAERTAGSFSNQAKALKNGLRDLGVQLGRILLPYALRLVKVFKSVSDRFQALSAGGKRTVVVIALMAAVIGPLLILAGTLTTAIAALVPVIAAISLPVAAVVGALVALGVAFVAAYSRSEEFRAVVNGALKGALKQVRAVVGDMRKTLKALEKFWKAHGKQITRIVVAGLRPLARIVGGLLRAVVGVVRAVLAVIRGDWRAAWGFLKGAAIAAVKGVASGLRALAGNFASVGTALGKALANALRDAINWVIGKWNDLELPSIKVKGKALTPSIGTPNLPMFARGGVATGPSIFGEAGPEAAVPLGMGSQARMDRRRVLAETGLGGHTFNITIHASSESGGRAAARGFLGALGGDARQRAYSSRVAVAR